MFLTGIVQKRFATFYEENSEINSLHSKYYRLKYRCPTIQFVATLCCPTTQVVRTTVSRSSATKRHTRKPTYQLNKDLPNTLLVPPWLGQFSLRQGNCNLLHTLKDHGVLEDGKGGWLLLIHFAASD